MFLQFINVLRVSDDPQEVLITDRIKPQEQHPLSLKVLAKSMLDPCLKVGEFFQTLQNTQDINSVHYQWAYRNFLYDSEELGQYDLKSLGLVRQEVLDIGTSCEDTLQVHPVSLDVNSHIKCSVYLVQSLLSSQSLVFKNLLKIYVYVWSIFKLHYTQKSLKIKSPIYNNKLYVSLPLSLPPSLSKITEKASHLLLSDQ